MFWPGTTFTADANATFIGNTAGDADNASGGAVSMIWGTTMDFTDSASTVLFDSNSTTGSGGAVGAVALNIFSTAADTTFDSNTAGVDGGALYLIDNSDFYCNRRPDFHK